MPVKIERTYKLSTNGGQTLYLSESEAQTLIVDETRAILTCDSSRCKARHAAENPQSITWVEEEVQKDPTKIPDNINTFVNFGQGKVACSPQCVRDYFMYDHVIPPSPKELRAKMDADKKKAAEELQALNPHLVQETKEAMKVVREFLTPEPTGNPPEKSKTPWSDAMAEKQPDGRTMAQHLYEEKAHIQKVEHTPAGPRMVPDPETSAKINALSDSVDGALWDENGNAKEGGFPAHLVRADGLEGHNGNCRLPEEVEAAVRNRITPMPAVEVPALCQEDEEGYGHGV
jgi:hypothetical protein